MLVSSLMHPWWKKKLVFVWSGLGFGDLMYSFSDEARCVQPCVCSSYPFHEIHFYTNPATIWWVQPSAKPNWMAYSLPREKFFTKPSQKPSVLHLTNSSWPLLSVPDKSNTEIRKATSLSKARILSLANSILRTLCPISTWFSLCLGLVLILPLPSAALSFCSNKKPEVYLFSYCLFILPLWHDSTNTIRTQHGFTGKNIKSLSRQTHCLRAPHTEKIFLSMNRIIYSHINTVISIMNLTLSIHSRDRGQDSLQTEFFS